MKNRNTGKTHGAKAAITATMVVVPMFGLGSRGMAQDPSKAGTIPQASAEMQEKSVNIFIKYRPTYDKYKGDTWIAGIGKGHPVYKNSNGDLFYLDPKTGDAKMVSADFGPIKGAPVGIDKMSSKVTLIGVDLSGNVIQKNSRGEKFYLNTKTGDMVFVK
jgi:hypothetical protein